MMLIIKQDFAMTMIKLCRYYLNPNKIFLWKQIK